PSSQSAFSSQASPTPERGAHVPSTQTFSHCALSSQEVPSGRRQRRFTQELSASQSSSSFASQLVPGSTHFRPTQVPWHCALLVHREPLGHTQVAFSQKARPLPPTQAKTSQSAAS